MIMKSRISPILLLVGGAFAVTALYLSSALSAARDDAAIMDALGRQRMLSQVMAKSVLGFASSTTHGEQTPDPALSEYELARSIFTQVQSAMISGGEYPADLAGDTFRSVSAIRDTQAQDLLAEASTAFATLEATVDTILSGDASVTGKLKLGPQANELGAANNDVVVRYGEIAAVNQVRIKWAAAAMVLPILLLGGFYIQMIRRDTARLIKMTDEANQLRLEADAANRAKSEFLASMSHEIRTPMNGVLGVADLMLMSELPDTIRENVVIIKESGDTLLSLLNGILDLSKIEAGKLKVELSEVNVVNLLGSTISLVESQIAKKGLWCSKNISETLVSPWIMTDATRLRQVLTNLISNAVKFTHKGGITLCLSQSRAEDGKVETRFEVGDTGIGLNDQERVSIFTAFTQADETITRKYGGTGLGLTISKQLVELMGGQIGVTSIPGKGSTFWFSIVGDEGAGKIAPDNQAAMSRAAGDSKTSERVARFLVAEDNATNQVVIGKLLKALGFQFEIVGNGQEAVDAVLNSDFDLVLMDINMPVLDGIGATRQIRGLPDDKGNLPIIAVTANAMEGDREKYITAGMDDHVVKPINPAQLMQVLAKHARITPEAQRARIKDAPARTINQA